MMKVQWGKKFPKGTLYKTVWDTDQSYVKFALAQTNPSKELKDFTNYCRGKILVEEAKNLEKLINKNGLSMTYNQEREKINSEMRELGMKVGELSTLNGQPAMQTETPTMNGPSMMQTETGQVQADSSAGSSEDRLQKVERENQSLHLLLIDAFNRINQLEHIMQAILSAQQTAPSADS